VLHTLREEIAGWRKVNISGKNDGRGKLMESETILIVDDNKEIVHSLGELLKFEGYRIETAYDGMEALEVLEQRRVDLILLDVMMPRLNADESPGAV